MTVAKGKKKKDSDDSLKGAGTMGKAARKGASSIRGKASHSRLQHRKIQEAFDRREEQKKAGKKPSPISPAMLEGVVDESGKYIDEAWYGKLTPSEKETVQKIRRKRMSDEQFYKRKYPTKGVVDLMSGEYLDGEGESGSIDEVKTVYEKEYEKSGSRILAKARARDVARKLNVDDKLTYGDDGKITYTDSTPSKGAIDKKEMPILEATTVPDKGKAKVTKEDLTERLVKYIDRSSMPAKEKMVWKKKLKDSKDPKKIMAALKAPPKGIDPIGPTAIVEREAALRKAGKWTKAEEERAAKDFMEASMKGTMGQVMAPPELSAPIVRPSVGIGAPAYGRMFGMGTRADVAVPPYRGKPLPDPESARIMAQRKRLAERGAVIGARRLYDLPDTPPKYVKINPAIMSKSDVERLMKGQKGKDAPDAAQWHEFHTHGKVTEKFWEPIVIGQRKLRKIKATVALPGVTQTELKKKLAAQKKAAEAEMVAGIRGIEYKDVAREAAEKEAKFRWVMKKDPKTGTMRRVKEKVYEYEGEVAARKWTPEEGVTKVISKPGVRTAVIKPEMLELTQAQRDQLAMMRTESIRNLEKQIGLMQDRVAAAKVAAKYIKKYAKKPASGYRVTTIQRAFAKQYPVGRWKLNIRRDRKNEIVYLTIIAPTSYKDPTTDMTVSPYGTKYELDSKITQILDHMNLRPAPGAEITEYRLPIVGKKHMRLKYSVKVVPL